MICKTGAQKQSAGPLRTWVGNEVHDEISVEYIKCIQYPRIEYLNMSQLISNSSL